MKKTKIYRGPDRLWSLLAEVSYGRKVICGGVLWSLFGAQYCVLVAGSVMEAQPPITQ